MKCSHKYFHSTCNSLSPQNNFFLNCQFFSNSEPSDMYISLSFLYTCGILEAYISLHSDICFLHIFCLGMFHIVGEVTWHGRWTPTPRERNFFEMLQTIFLHVLLCPHQQFFHNSQFFTIWEPSAIYISLWHLYKFSTIEAYTSVHIDLFLHFLFGNVLNRSWVKWYGMADEPPIWSNVQLTYQSDGHPLWIWNIVRVTFQSHIWVFLHFTRYFKMIRLHSVVFITCILLFHKKCNTC